ncbi:hypothetical protein BGX23_002669 [Mortierella sp. AD031]|nr:hypothetical protein BGX23_002669 [Mortierella sp. AD031]
MLLHLRSNPTSFSSSPPTSLSSVLSEHKPVPAAQSKVHDLARRFSAISKQSTAENNNNGGLSLPHGQQQRTRGGSFGRTEGSMVSGLLNKFAEPKTTPTANSAFKGVSATAAAVNTGHDGVEAKDVKQSESEEKPPAETIAVQEAAVVVREDEDMEKEIELSLNVTELSSKVLQLDLDLVDVPLSNNNSTVHVNEELDDDEMAKAAIVDENKPIEHENVVVSKGLEREEGLGKAEESHSS